MKIPVMGSMQSSQAIVYPTVDTTSLGPRANKPVMGLHGTGTTSRRKCAPLPRSPTSLLTVPALASVRYNATMPALKRVVVSDHSPAKLTCSATASRSMVKTKTGDPPISIVIPVQCQHVTGIERDSRGSGICMTTSREYIQS